MRKAIEGEDSKDEGELSPFLKWSDKVSNIIYGRPAQWIRKNVVEKFQGPPYPYYHKKLPRVPTIDQCEIGDRICEAEADAQAVRDKRLENRIIELLKYRLEDCKYEYGQDYLVRCDKLRDAFEIARTNYFTKWGDVGYPFTAANCLMKQKHRMIWQRRHPGYDLTGLSNYQERKIEQYRSWDIKKQQRFGVDKLIKEFDDQKVEQQEKTK